MYYTIQPKKCRLVNDGRKLKLPAVKAEHSEQGAAIAQAMLDALPHEEIIAILLNGANAVIGVVKIGQGGLHGCSLTPADVLRPAIIAGARAIILAHNHPSGDPTPSSEDVGFTQVVRAACEVVGLTLLDHLIVTGKGRPWASMLERGLM